MSLGFHPIASQDIGTVRLARRATAGLCAWIVGAILCAAPAGAAPTLGFIENWTGVSTDGWGGGSAATNPGAGGLGGAGDGFLMVTNATLGNFGTQSSGPEYTGDWVAAGITFVHVWLNDVGTPNSFEIHFSIGRPRGTQGVSDLGNFWQYNIGFIPPSNQWKEFVVDLTNSGDWTQLFGTGTFTNALQTAGRIHLRHDHAPFISSPDPAAGDLGIDHLMLSDAAAAVGPGTGSVGPAVELAAPQPNPSRGPVALAMTSPDGGPIHIQILDATGRMIRTAELPPGSAGARRWTWDGADDGGRLTAPGVYRVRAFGASGGMSRPLVRVR
jgi:hypothetical protein